MVRGWRERLGNGALIIASVGIHEPHQALELKEAGANLVEIDSGLVYARAGLPKRVNEAMLHIKIAKTHKFEHLLQTPLNLMMPSDGVRW